MLSSFTKLTRIPIFIALIATCFASTSCSLHPKKYFGEKINLAGVFTHEPSSYTPVETGTFRVTSDDLVNRDNHKGGKTTFLWGLFTYTDY
tara:strand:+ start:1089 stop:1361 length:273 start_codon:yes stop_codon:yes gene_type:complete